jgi:hypothetical protein
MLLEWSVAPCMSTRHEASYLPMSWPPRALVLKASAFCEGNNPMSLLVRQHALKKEHVQALQLLDAHDSLSRYPWQLGALLICGTRRTLDRGTAAL